MVITEEEFEKYAFLAENAKIFRAKSAVVFSPVGDAERISNFKFDGTVDKVIFRYSSDNREEDPLWMIESVHSYPRKKEVRPEDFIRTDVVLKKGQKRSIFFANLMTEIHRIEKIEAEKIQGEEEIQGEEITWIFTD